MNQQMRAGFNYLVEVVTPEGQVREAERVHNLVPAQGLNHMLDVTLKGSAQAVSWYIGLYEGNYTPTPGDTASGFPTNATESSTYDEATRVPLTLGNTMSGTTDNSLAKAEFTMNSPKTIYGGFISSSAAKMSASGTLLSAVRFSSPKVLAPGEILRVTAGFTLASI